jgi:hypothetical protein
MASPSPASDAARVATRLSSHADSAARGTQSALDFAHGDRAALSESLDHTLSILRTAEDRARAATKTSL